VTILINCIYCRDLISSSNQSDEHVFPKAFGCPNTWTLDCVCRPCNQTLGGELERYLASDSLEGLERLRTIGSRSKKPICQSRIQLSLPDDDIYGDYRGIIVFADFTQPGHLYLPSQVVIEDDKGRKSPKLIDSVTSDDIEELRTRKYFIFANDETSLKSAFSDLENLGIKTQLEREAGLPQTLLAPPGQIQIPIQGRIDEVIYRSIAKISFNYLAKTKGTAFALESRFDEVREYIRYGKIPRQPVVSIVRGHILSDETNNGYSFSGHIFTIEEHRMEVVSKICLWNCFDFYYLVRLGSMGSIWYDIKVGHAFDMQSKELHEMCSPTFLNIRA